MSIKQDEITFETAFDQLARIVNELERGDLDLSGSLASYERGVALLARCQSLLDGVDRSVALLTGVEADGTPITTEFDASATVSSETAKPVPKTTTRSRKSPAAELPPTVIDDIDPPF